MMVSYLKSVKLSSFIAGSINTEASYFMLDLDKMNRYNRA